jgi:putative flippase GtrA
LSFVTYAFASWLGIGIQYVLTLWLSGHMYYLLANLIAIVLASISNFVANDRWTFRRRPPPFLRTRPSFRRPSDARARRSLACSRALTLVMASIA